MTARKSLLLRIRPELWEELNRWAAREFRSVNGQIEFLLQRAVDEQNRQRPREARPGRDEPDPAPQQSEADEGRDPP
jgi:hypothetical protein